MWTLLRAALLLVVLWACSRPPDPPQGEGIPRPEAARSRATPGGALAALDRCAPTWWRTDRSFTDRRTCTRGQDLREIAAAGGVVLLGSTWDVVEPRSPIPAPRRCEGPTTHAQNRAFFREILEARPRDPLPLAFVHLHRFDLVPVSLAAQPGFDPDFLVRTRRPWNEVLDFFGGDPTPLCRGGRCSWSDSITGDPSNDPGERLRDYIDRRGGPGRYRSVVYYLSSAGPGKRVQWPNAALGDLRHPGYRAWRVAEAARAMEAGGYDAIMLNAKFSQYRRPGGHWIGGESARDVEQLNETRTTLWSAQPDGYGYAEYLAGWAALGRDLRRAGVPYAVWLPEPTWRAIFARPGSPTPVDPLLETARGASLVLLHGATSPETTARIEEDVRAHGGRLVLQPARPELCGRPGSPVGHP
jgi:hypothetical protein